MGGGGGGVDIKDSEDQKALANIAKEKWQMYNEKFVPLENQWMEEIDSMNSQAQYDRAAGVANAASQSSQGAALEQVMSQGGNAGQINRSINGIAEDSASDRTDNINRMQVNQQNRYVQGLQAINAVGQGKETQAIGSMGDAANISDQYAQDEAMKSFNKGQSNREVAGSVVGAGTRWGIG